MHDEHRPDRGAAPRKPRRFGLGDLMILIVAIGAATVGVRALWQRPAEGPGGAYYWDATPSRLLAAAALSSVAAPLTIAGLVIRARRPRPAWRRVALQPGTAAMIACAVVFAAQAAEAVAALRAPAVEILSGYEVSAIRYNSTDSLVLIRAGSNGVIGHIEPIGCFGLLVTSLATPCGPAVAAVWVVLAVAGRWRPERSWIDRLGRLLGVLWIAISALAVLPVGPG